MYLIHTPHQNFMDAFRHVTPVLKEILDLCRFDLMCLTPPPKFYGCISSRYTCVKGDFRSMQIWLDVFDPPGQNFTDAFHHVTPVLKEILDLCRFDLTYLTLPPKFYGCILSRYTSVKGNFRSMQIWLDVTLNNTINIHKTTRHNADKHSCFKIKI